MSYESEMKALTYNPIGYFSRENCEIYWSEYAKLQLENSLTNLYIKYC